MSNLNTTRITSSQETPKSISNTGSDFLQCGQEWNIRNISCFKNVNYYRRIIGVSLVDACVESPGSKGQDGNPGAPGQSGTPGGTGEKGICPKYCAIDGRVFFEDGTRR